MNTRKHIKKITCKHKYNRNHSKTRYKKCKKNKSIYKGGMPLMAVAGLAKKFASSDMAASLMKGISKGTVSSQALSKIQGEPSAPGFLDINETDGTIKKMIKQGIIAVGRTFASIFTLPIRNLDELIPEELCKQYVDNKFVCSQRILELLFTGTKKDHRKILPDADKNKCITYNEDGNKIVQCKQEGGYRPEKGSYNQHGGSNEMIIECSKHIKFNIGDNVMVKCLDDKLGEFIQSGKDKWYIGNITSIVSNKYTIKLINGTKEGDEITVTGTDDIEHYNKEWGDYYTNFEKKKNYAFKLFGLGNVNLIDIKKIYNNASTQIEITLDILRNTLTPDEKVKIKKVMDNYKSDRNSVNGKLYECTMIILLKSKNKSIEIMLKYIEVSKKRINTALRKNLNLIEEKLIKVNIYLRKYQCPEDKIKSLISSIKDKELLKKMYEVCNSLLGETAIFNDIQTDKERLETCDTEYNKNSTEPLKVNPDARHLGTLIFPNPKLDCKECNKINLWAETLGKYMCLFSSTIEGNKNNINYIILNIIRDMSKIVIDTKNEDPIINRITDILKNIECRSNLRKVIHDQMTK